MATGAVKEGESPELDTTGGGADSKALVIF